MQGILASIFCPCYARYMNQMLHQCRLFFLTFSLLAAGMLPLHAHAQSAPDEVPALVTIRFNQPHVYFDQQLYGAIAKALAAKPDVTFEVVSCAPVTGNAQTDQQWQAQAGSNTRAVIAAMNAMGVPMNRISVLGQSMTGLRYDETRVFVR